MRRRPAAADPAPAFRGRLLTVGSVLHFATAGDVVWGSGLNGKVATELPAVLDVRALRGPFTRCAVLAAGLDAPAVHGDPALLAAELWPELRPASGGPDRGPIAVPNLHEIERFDEAVRVSPIGDPFEVMREIAGAEFVTGSSLHGVILADAFGIPSRPVRSEVEHPFKYVDYYASTGRYNVEFASSFEHALELGPVPVPEIDLDALVRAFPADLWTHDGQPAPESSPAGGRGGPDEAGEALGRLRERIGGRPTPEESVSLALLEERLREASARPPAGPLAEARPPATPERPGYAGP